MCAAYLLAHHIAHAVPIPFSYWLQLHIRQFEVMIG